MIDWRRILQERRAVILPLGIIVAVNVAVLLLLVLPLRRSVTTMHDDAAAATAGLANARRLARQARDAATGRQRADTDLQQFYTKVLPVDLATAEKTTNSWITQASRDAGLVFKTSRFQHKPLRESRLTRAYSEVTLEGRYSNIRRFLYAVENAQEFIIIEKVELAQAGDRQPGTNGLLDVSLVVATYYLTPPS